MKSFATLATLVAATSALPWTRREESSSNGTAPIQNPAVWENLRGKIKHVVYLMMENHSVCTMRIALDSVKPLLNAKRIWLSLTTLLGIGLSTQISITFIT